MNNPVASPKPDVAAPHPTVTVPDRKPPQRAVHLLAAVLLACLALAACGSSTSTSTPKAGAKAVSAISVTIKNYQFSPDTFTVTPGAKITVTNKDSVAHTFTATPGSTPKGSFDTGDIAQNQTKTVTAPSTPGTYKYDCTIHSFMTGSFTVS